MQARLKKGFFVGALYCVVALGVAVPWLMGPLGEGNPRLRLGLLVLAGAAWAIALIGSPRWPENRGVLFSVIVGAVVLRILAQLGNPGTSDDVYRYIWEGALVLEGQSPYAEAPSAAGRAPEQQRWPELYAAINHPEVSAAYPPLTQAACAIGVWAAGGTKQLDQPGGWRRAWRSMRLLFGLADLALLLPLGLLLRKHGRPLTLLVAWAWCPMVALESGGAPHFDALGILLLMLGLAAGAKERWRSAALWLAGGALVKWLPLMATPFVGRDLRRSFKLVGLALGTILGAFVLTSFLAGGLSGLFGGLGEYAFRWESFNLVFRWIEGPLRSHLPADEGWNDARRVARFVIMLLFSSGALMLWWRRVEALRAVALLVALFLLLSPTLHPWYLLWCVPFLAFWPSPAFLWLLVTIPLAYWPLGRWHSQGVWIEPSWLWPSVALPCFALLALECLQTLRKRRRLLLSSDAAN